MASMTKDQVVAAISRRKRETHSFEIPEWDGELRIRRLLTADLEASGITQRQDEDTMLRAIALSLCDEHTEPLFSLKDLDALRDLDAIVVIRLFAEVAKYNGMSTPELEELVAGFGEAPPEG